MRRILFDRCMVNLTLVVGGLQIFLTAPAVSPGQYASVLRNENKVQVAGVIWGA